MKRETLAMPLVESIREWGIVGAGGAGFPTHVKVAAKAQMVIVNAAECEPLLHKDQEIMANHTEDFLAGLEAVMDAVGAANGLIGIKEKHHELIEQLRAEVGPRVRVTPIADFYPAGDEITLIYETTGKVVKAGALPISQGVIVNNVETLLNVGRARPVITKFLNITGEVERPVTLEVPIGTSFADVLAYAGPKRADFALLVGGPMMGRLCDDIKEPVTKTTSALILLPPDHGLVQRYRVMQSPSQVRRIGKSACDQCTFCTELCPRALLGHPIQPHRAMRSLLFSPVDADTPETHTLFCCECNLCSFVSCPEGLFPGRVCGLNKRAAIAAGAKYEGMIDNTPHPLIGYRRTPSKKLKRMLDLNKFKDVGPRYMAVRLVRKYRRLPSRPSMNSW